MQTETSLSPAHWVAWANKRIDAIKTKDMQSGERKAFARRLISFVEIDERGFPSPSVFVDNKGQIHLHWKHPYQHKAIEITLVDDRIIRCVKWELKSNNVMVYSKDYARHMRAMVQWFWGQWGSDEEQMLEIVGEG